MLMSEMCRYKISISLFVRFSKLISVAERKNKSFFIFLLTNQKTCDILSLATKVKQLNLM